LDTILQREVAEAGFRLQEAISRCVNESPECFRRKNGQWVLEFQNQVSGERIMVTYSGPTTLAHLARQN